MKRVALNRKHSLFVGDPRGGRTAAILASLTSSCRRHEMDPQLYFMQLLMNLPSWILSAAGPILSAVIMPALRGVRPFIFVEGKIQSSAFA